MAYYSARILNPTQGEEIVRKILDRRWALTVPDTKIHRIKLYPRKLRQYGGKLGGISFVNETNPLLGDNMGGDNKKEPCFYLVRDDLLHPLANGNKARKLDALLPLIEDLSITDVVTCGGCQSAHTAAVAVSCAERGIRSNLLLRGEQPEVLTGYNLVSKMFGHVTYVPRSLYANRIEMLNNHASKVAGENGSIVWFQEIFETSLKSSKHLKLDQVIPHSVGENSPRRVGIINEGAGDAVALLGVIRLVQYLSQDHIFGRQRTLKFIVDAGTGTTAVGLGLAAHILGLPWEITAIMLADTMVGYQNQESRLISEFKKLCALCHIDHNIDGVDAGVVHWVPRHYPRRFGKVLEPEIETCQQIAQQTGVLVDPIYTLAAWELAALPSEKEANQGANVVMLHTGGTLGLFGLAQRYKSYFDGLKDGIFS